MQEVSCTSLLYVLIHRGEGEAPPPPPPKHHKEMKLPIGPFYEGSEI